jgi:nitroreductase
VEVFEAIKSRRSIRAFSEEGVTSDQIEKILDAGRSAPSAGNLQARDFFVISDEQTKNELARAALDQKFIAQAPVVIVVCSNLECIGPYGQRGIELYCLQDAAASVQNMLLIIHSLGLASCWIGAFNEDEASQVLKLPGHLRPVAILPVGYPGESAKERKKSDDDVHWL